MRAPLGQKGQGRVSNKPGLSRRTPDLDQEWETESEPRDLEGGACLRLRGSRSSSTADRRPTATKEGFLSPSLVAQVFLMHSLLG